MFYNDIEKQLNPVRDAAKQILTDNGGAKVWSFNNFFNFFSNLGTALQCILEDPEIVFFAVLQWIAIGCAYVLWTKILLWIPDSVWQAVERKNNRGAFDGLNLLLLLWSFLIVAIASYPISIFTAAIVAVRNLRENEENSTILTALMLGTRHVGRMWAFTTVDSWITVSAILDRLPSKDNRRTPLDELLYYAWKVATVGMVPALVNGRSMVAAGKESLQILRATPMDVIGIRMGYSLLCWLIGIFSYIGSIYFFIHFGGSIFGAHEVYNFYVLMAFPIVLAVGIVSVLVRPLYLLMISVLYVDALALSPDTSSAPEDIISKKLFSWHFVLFLLLLSCVIVAYFYGDRLGITAWVNHIADKDLATYHQQANP